MSGATQWPVENSPETTARASQNQAVGEWLASVRESVFFAVCGRKREEGFKAVDEPEGAGGAIPRA
jgi:hypothetical protein